MATEEFEGDADDRILDLFDEYTREVDASRIAESFFATGEDQLDNFIDRHEGAFGDGAQERMYATLAMMRNQAELVSEQGDRGLGNAELRHLIVQKDTEESHASGTSAAGRPGPTRANPRRAHEPAPGTAHGVPRQGGAAD